MGLGRLRERMGSDTERMRRRRLRRIVRHHLGAAEAHRDAGKISAFYIEIDRVLREVLAAHLGTPVAGLRMDELSGVLRARDATRVLAEQSNVEFVDIGITSVDIRAVSLLSWQEAEKLRAIPIRLHPDDTVSVAVADPP